MAKFSYYLDDEFVEYLEEKVGLNKKQACKYKGYITTVYKKLLKPNGIAILIDKLGECLAQDSAKALDGLKLISAFIKRVYSLSKQPYLGAKSLSFIANHGMTPKSFNDYGVGLDYYIRFIESSIINSSNGYYPVTPWNQACNKLKDIFYDNISVNGMDSLMGRFSNNEDFIGYALKNSFFFTKEMAEERFSFIVEKIKDNDPEGLYARSSKKHMRIKKDERVRFYFSCSDESDKTEHHDIEITIDDDGNKAVRELIKTKTGYTLSSGENCLFTNYIISHIWGDAFDPRNFTNIWNLALVPAWANSLLDKQNYGDKLTKQLLNTFKAVCYKQYNMNSFKWDGVYKKHPHLDPDYVVTGEYSIHVVHQRKKKKSVLEPYGKIVVETIKIEDKDINDWKVLFSCGNTAG